MRSGQIVGRLVLISLPFYFAWEMAQMPAFTGAPAGWVGAMLLCAFAAVLDTTLVLALHAVGVWAFGDRLWFRPPRAGRYVVVVVAAVAVNAVWEWLAVTRLGLWGYSPLQPTVVGIGLLAILQAVVVPPLTFCLLARWSATSPSRLALSPIRAAGRRDPAYQEAHLDSPRGAGIESADTRSDQHRSFRPCGGRAMATATTTHWQLKGQGYEFCNCDFGCGCNFGGFPNSKDGSCRALVGLNIGQGACADVDLSGVKCAGIYSWPKAIHEGHGKVAFVVDPATTDRQVEALAQIFTGKLGGMPWEVLGPTAEVVGLVKARITIQGSGRKSTFRVDGVGEGRGDTFKNPVTGEDHLADVVLPTGFIWKKGECGQGSFHAAAAGVSVASDKTNWIYYNFDWSNG